MITAIEESGIGGDRLEEIRQSGLFSALLSARNLSEVDHAEFRRVLNLSIKQFIFCDHDPFTDGFGNPGDRLNLKDYKDYKILQHQPMGRIVLEKRDNGELYVNGSRVIRYQAPRQLVPNPRVSGGKWCDGIEASELFEALKGKRALNACFRNLLLNHEELIPRSWNVWKQEYTYFWGTTFECPGNLEVSCLIRDDHSNRGGGGCFDWSGMVWDYEQDRGNEIYRKTFADRDYAAILED
jgi:hypothetical protein